MLKSGTTPTVPPIGHVLLGGWSLFGIVDKGLVVYGYEASQWAASHGGLAFPRHKKKNNSLPVALA